MAGLYRIFDLTFQCGFPLPELSKSFASDASLSVRLGEPDVFDSSGFETAFEWRDHADRLICWCERRGDEYLYVYPQYARFHVTSDGRIDCLLHTDSDMHMLRHLLLNQVIPRYLASTGHLVLHASAVTLETGQTVAFLGNSGFGKSTLASSFHRNGARLINDDCILMHPRKDGVSAIGSFAGIRLFPDSVHAVFDEVGGFTRYTPYTDKQQLVLKGEAGTSLPDSACLDAIFLLDDPAEIEQGESVQIEPASGTEAMMAMIYCAFSLDPSDKQVIVSNFRNIGQAIGKQLGVYRLRYPRVHERLPEVRAAVMECDFTSSRT
jgi:hypothetical protein